MALLTVIVAAGKVVHAYLSTTRYSNYNKPF